MLSISNDRMPVHNVTSNVTIFLQEQKISSFYYLFIYLLLAFNTHTYV